MNGLHGIVFSYKKRPELRELVEHRMPASVPFGGSYRAIDFALSNLRNAGVTDVGVVLHGNYQSVLDHLGSGKVWDMSRKYGGLKLLPPFADNRPYSAGAFRGRMEALAGVRSYLAEIRQDYVVLSNSDLIINYPLDAVFREHLASQADITAMCIPVRELSPTGIYFRLYENGDIAQTYCDAPFADTYRSLEIYILRRDLLLSLVDECAAQNKYNFGRDVLAGMSGRLKLHAYVWRGYAAQLRSVKEYYDRSMELLDPAVRAALFAPDRPIFAKVDDGASSYFVPGSSVKNSIIADGCTIEGTVENSIIFPGVHVGSGACVRNCIIFKNVSVGEGAQLSCVIADKYVRIEKAHQLISNANYPVVISRDSAV